jgi:hypothetical protein
MMKKFLPVFIAVLASLGAFSQTAKVNLTGKWLDAKTAEEGFRFDDSGFCFFITDGAEIGGDSIDVEGVTVQLKYVVDKSKIPYLVDFVRVYKATGKEDDARMLGLINPVDENTIELMIGDTRPVAIDKESSDYLKLKRAK